MQRGWMDHTVFKPEPYTEREAWMWMIEHAAWKPMEAYVKGKVVNLERGQLTYSLRFMAGKWQWTVKRVRVFLKTLTNVNMIKRKKGAQQGIQEGAQRGAHSQNIITICNYNIYQASGAAEGHSDGNGQGHSQGQLEGTAGAQQGHKEEEGKDLERNITTSSPSIRASENEPSPDDVKAVVDSFFEVRERCWPNDPNFLTPVTTLEAEARAYLDQGATPDLCRQVFIKVMGDFHTQKKSGPRSLRFCWMSIESEIAKAKKANGEGPKPTGFGSGDPQTDFNAEEMARQFRKWHDEDGLSVEEIRRRRKDGTLQYVGVFPEDRKQEA